LHSSRTGSEKKLIRELDAEEEQTMFATTAGKGGKGREAR
jgi:hypothetical protein